MTDYDRISTAIAYVAGRVGEQPTLEEIAAQVHLSPFHFQRLFSRWVGVSPKRFLQVLTVERAKALLDDANPLLEVAGALGLSGSSRLHDHFIQLEAVTPGQYKAGGAGLSIDYGEDETPFGRAFVAFTRRGICQLSFLDEAGSAPELAALRHRWPGAEIRERASEARALVDTLFAHGRTPDRPLSLLVSGTNFQISVWKALLAIPSGHLATYSRIAAAIGQPRAARAVGLAVGANPVAFVIPCHRVIRQSGQLGGYRWGIPRKLAMHAWEAAREDMPDIA